MSLAGCQLTSVPSTRAVTSRPPCPPAPFEQPSSQTAEGSSAPRGQAVEREGPRLKVRVEGSRTQVLLSCCSVVHTHLLQ